MIAVEIACGLGLCGMLRNEGIVTLSDHPSPVDNSEPINGPPSAVP